MTHLIDNASLALMAELATSAARSFLLAGIAVAMIAVLGLRATSHRLFVWTSVLYASLALPLLGWLVPSLPIPLPGIVPARVAKIAPGELPTVQSRNRADARGAASHTAIRFAGREARFLVSTATADRPLAVAPASGSLWWTAIPWTRIAAAVYASGVAFLLLRFIVGLLLSRRIVGEAKVITDLLAAERVGHDSSASLRIAMSDQISVPLTVGLLRPTILLPAGWREWDQAKLRAVLAHEQSHVARRDPLTQSISLLYRALFWFSPLSWWLHWQLETLAEQASDEAALSSGADQKHYARTLLGFFEALQASPGRVRWQGVSMARAGQAERRLERILNWKGTVSMSLKRSLAIAILVLAVPVVALVAAVRPVRQVSAAVKSAVYQAAPPAPAAAPVGGVSATAPSGGVSRQAPVAGIPSVGAVTAIAPVAPTAPIGASAPQAPGGFSYSYGYDDDERFVIASGKSDSFTMSGSTQDVHHVEKLKKQISGDFIWFQRDEESYIIRDQATIDRARKLFAPQEELGRKQEELGTQQEALGKQQEALGKKMEQVRINVPDMTAELDRLKAKLQKLGPTATMEQIGDLQSEIGELQSKIGELQGRAGEEQGKLGALQGELGEKQGKLGEEQGELGRRQGELAEKAAKEMKVILDEAIKNGTAKPERDTVKSPSL